MLVALLFQTITLASGDYRAVLLAGLTFAVIADGCFIAAFIRGGLMVRSASIFLILATAFVLFDFLRRAPYLIG